jgi:hypothetical protein
MKKIIVILVLSLLVWSCKSASSSSALLQTIKYEKAVLTYVNGDVVKGYAEVADAFYSKIKFKQTEKGKVESVVSDDLKKIEYVDKDGKEYVAERLYKYVDKGAKGVIKKDKLWLFVAYSNGMKLAILRSGSGYVYNGSTGTSTGSGASTGLFMGKDKEDGVFFVYDLSDQMSINVGLDKSVRKHCDLLFKDCPKFLEAVHAENFKKNTLANSLVELYETNDCNKPVVVATPKKATTKKKK